MKKILRGAAACAAALLLLCAQSHAQHTATVTASSILTGGTPGGGTPMPYGKVCAMISNPANDVPMSVTETGWGLVPAGRQFCANISSGAISGLPVPDANHTNYAVPVVYDFSIQQTDGSGNPIGLPVWIRNVPGVTGTFALDAYAPPVSVPAPSPALGYGSSVPSSCTAPSIWTTPGGSAYTCEAGVYVPLNSSVTAAAMQTAVAGQSGCTTAGYAWDPAANTCAPAVSASNASTCTANTATYICLAIAPYYVSGSGLSTTTTTGTNAPGTTINLTAGGCAAALFDAADAGVQYGHQGVNIAGAGSAGGTYIGTVVTCVPGTPDVMTLASATSTSVSGGAVVKHDETAGMQLWLTNSATSGLTGQLPVGHAEVNGPFRTTSLGNQVILQVPTIPLSTAAQVAVSLQGVTPITSGSGPEQDEASWIDTDANTGSLIGGDDSAGLQGHFTAVDFFANHIHFHSTQTNPGVVMINANYFTTEDVENSTCDSAWTPGTNPTNTAGACIITPTNSNDVRNILDKFAASGFYNGAIIQEHVRAQALYSGGNTNCWVFNGGGTQADGITVGHVWSQECTNFIAAGSTNTTINIQMADSEVSYTTFCNDPSNLLYGDVWYMMPYNDSRSTSTVTTPAVNGCANLRIHNLTTGQCFGSLCYDSTFLTHGLAESWPSQEGHGSALENAGFDFTNKATSTSVTWTTLAGFSRKVATYNGTSSYSIGTVNDGHDGSLPFSYCVTINGTAFSGGNFYPPISSGLLTGSSPGWNMGIGNFDSNHVYAYLSNSISGSNFIEVHGSTSINAGTTYNVCVGYDGSKTAAGVSIYVNGAAETMHTNQDTLTGSILSSAPITIGNQGGSGGSQFFPGVVTGVKVWNRLLSPAEFAAQSIAGAQVF